jgi:hypothetical protein
VTESRLGNIVARAAERAKQQKQSSISSNTTLISLYSRLRADPVIANAVRPEDPPNKLRDGLIPRAGEKLVPYLAEYTVQPHQLQQKVAELANSSVFIAAAAQRPGKVEMFDFFLMHSVNASIWFPVFINQSWISDTDKCRLVLLKGWSDLVTYAACKTPALYPDRAWQYRPKKPGDWKSIFQRATRYNDDGHTAKFIRAIKNAEQLSTEFVGVPGFELKPQQCLNIAHMVMDSVERMNSPEYQLPRQATFVQGMDQEVRRIIFRWVRWSGLDEAWEHVPDLSNSARL